MYFYFFFLNFALSLFLSILVQLDYLFPWLFPCLYRNLLYCFLIAETLRASSPNRDMLSTAIRRFWNKCFIFWTYNGLMFLRTFDACKLQIAVLLNMPKFLAPMPLCFITPTFLVDQHTHLFLILMLSCKLSCIFWSSLISTMLVAILFLFFILEFFWTGYSRLFKSFLVTCVSNFCGKFYITIFNGFFSFN